MKVMLLNGQEVLSSCSMSECMEAMSQAFSLAADKDRIESPLRTRLNVTGSRDILIMPSLVRGTKTTGSVKLLSVYPDAAPGNPAISAAVLLMDGDDGRVSGLLDGATLTALRTGAVSGLSCRYLARNDSRVIGIVGAGAQAYHQVEGVAAALPIQEVKIFSRREAKSSALAARCRISLRLKATTVGSAADCVQGSDVVITATTSRTPVFDGRLVGAGTHVIAMGAYTPDTRETDSSLVSRASIFVDSKEACLAEAGDILIPMREGAITKDSIKAEMSELVTGRKAGRSASSEITLFKSVGLAFEDNAAGWLAYSNARRRGVGRWVEF